jgi:hypothetical protein
MLSITKGSMDIASTPFRKKDKEGNETFFYKKSKDEQFKKFFVSAEDCPRHTKEFLENEKKNMSRLHYAQEYLAQFLDELKRLFDENLINNCCKEKRRDRVGTGKFYIGCDIAGYGEDECTYEILEKMQDKSIVQRDSIIEKRNLTTDTSKKIITLNNIWNFKKIGVDDGGVGFGVFSELMNEEKTKKKTEALNNASRQTDNEGERTKRLLKEEMYFNLLMLMEQGRIKLLDDDEIKASLSSIQYDGEKIWGSYSHICEGIIRGAWLAEKDKSLNIFAHSF